MGPLDDLEWVCHVCGKIRPDNKISVFSRTKILPYSGVPITENIRHCNDNPDCIEGAKTKSFLGDNK